MEDKNFIEKLRGQEEIKANEHDASYEAVQKTVELYKNSDKSKLNFHDLDLIYLLTIGEWSSSISNKINKIRKCNLLESDKGELISYLENLEENIKKDKYEKDNYGMFGTGFFSYKSGNDKTPGNKEVKSMIEMFIKIHEEQNEGNCIQIADKYTKSSVYGMGAGSLSQILHCIKPKVFPVLNSKGVDIYEYLGIDLNRPKSMTNYVENVRKIRKFRDDNFQFKNYRVIDNYWSYVESELKKSEKEQQELSSPLSSFFKNWDEAYWTFDFLYEVCKKLGVNNHDDPRITMSYSSNKIHLSFTNWLIAGIYSQNRSNSRFIIPLYKEKGYKYGEFDSEFTTDEETSSIALFEVEKSKLKNNNSELRKLFDDTLKYIKNLKDNYKHSPYRYSNREKLTKSIFDKKVRENLFKEGLEISKNYFWLTSAVQELTFDDKREGDVVIFNSINQNTPRKGSPKRKIEDIKKIKEKDIIVGYHSVSKKLGIWALLEAKETLNDNKIKMEIIKKLDEPIKKEKVNKKLHKDLNLSGKTIHELSKEEFNVIEELINHLLKNKVAFPSNLDIDFNIKLSIDKLYFPPIEAEKLKKRITSNLRNGKHIILTGPPGTGKSKLAKEIVNQYVDDNFKMVTARSDWSTFDTIGGYRPERNGELNFDSGVFLECFKSNGVTDNKWLIIDEINRADIDKAFGSLFSALTGDAVSLSFKNKNNRNIKIIPQDGKVTNNADNIYTIPDDWRIIATMNTYDKTSLYEMSYAFMRRFAFIPVSIPYEIDKELVIEYLKCWNIDNHEYIEDVSKLWNSINKVRKIGPAIVEDIYRYLLDNKKSYDSVIISYVLPQFEGVRKENINNFIAELQTLNFIDDKEIESIKNFADDYFRLGVQ